MLWMVWSLRLHQVILLNILPGIYFGLGQKPHQAGERRSSERRRQGFQRAILQPGGG